MIVQCFVYLLDFALPPQKTHEIDTKDIILTIVAPTKPWNNHYRSTDLQLKGIRWFHNIMCVRISDPRNYEIDTKNITFRPTLLARSPIVETKIRSPSLILPEYTCRFQDEG